MKKTDRAKAVAKGRAILRARRAANPNYDRDRIAKSVQASIAKKLRCGLTQAFRMNAKRGAAIRRLGCTIEFLKLWLASQFQPGMTLGNYGAWHIDHKIPLSSFDLTDPDQVLIACNWRNLQPLWARDNISKGDKKVWQPEIIGLGGLLSEAG